MEAFPLSWPPGWPRSDAHRRVPGEKFRGATFGRARDDLFRELRLLGARDVILSTNVPLRLDGLPYANARPVNDDPGVAVYFTLRKRPMAMARDAFRKVEANLRSLGLAIEHLRGLERHGGATMVERAFSGFAQLPAPRKRTCWEVLGIVTASAVGMDPEDVESCFRQAAKQHHPDHGGTDAQMAELNAARVEALRQIAEVRHG